MRSTLFFIPHALGPLPVFGLGWAVLVLALVWLVKALIARGRGRDWGAVFENAVPWVVAGLVMVFVLPRIETTYTTAGAEQYPVGLPIRGYGLFLMSGVLAAIGLTYLRLRPAGMSIDGLLSLSFTTVIGGVLGARLFFVIQKWSELEGTTVLEKLWEAVQFTEGGLVVYGSFIGGFFAVWGWCWKHRVRLLVLGDALVPGLMIGLALGRLGCLMNGCCYGGVCESALPSITFPRGSPPYMDQLISGKLIGKPSAAVRTHLYPPGPDKDPAGPPEVVAELSEQPGLWVPVPGLPERSLPTHPSQIYAAINAALLCGFLFSLWPNVRRDGVVIGLWLMMMGVGRMLEEWIRVDEAGQFGTSLTIAQWISLAGIVGGGVLLAIRLRYPPGRLALVRPG